MFGSPKKIERAGIEEGWVPKNKPLPAWATIAELPLLNQIRRTVKTLLHSNQNKSLLSDNECDDHLPLTWHIALTTVYALTCYTVIVYAIVSVSFSLIKFLI